jgi:hypothetical protein
LNKGLLTGAEALYIQGFEKGTTKLGELTNSQLRKLAGNTISVPVVGALLSILLANFVDIANEMAIEEKAPCHINQPLSDTPCRVGSARVGETSSMDSLPLRDVSVKQARLLRRNSST